MKLFMSLMQLWVVAGDAPTGIDLRCANEPKKSNKLIVQGCVCDKAGTVKYVYSQGPKDIYPREYCPGKKAFMPSAAAPGDFCYSGPNAQQKVICINI